MLDLTYVPATPDTGGWKQRHLNAVFGRTNAATPISEGIKAWNLYAKRHLERYESRIGDDYVLGPAWAQWGAALRTLLNGECGQADCATLDHIIYENMIEQGIDPEAI